MTLKSKTILAGCSRSELEAAVLALGQPKFRADQIARWLYQNFTADPMAMPNLPRAFREQLKNSFIAPAVRKLNAATAPDGAGKLRLELPDSEQIELALIPTPQRNTACLSTQVGCPVRCRFCASGAHGLIRNLQAGEMLEEFMLAAREFGAKPDNVVFMGIGEGLLNFSELKTTLDRLTGPEYFAMSPRRITVSTSGYLPGIRQLAALKQEFTLAISLHAPDDETRARLIPDPLRFPIADILHEADRYRELAGRMVTLEYALIADLNDAPEHARKLAAIALAHHTKVNLIPYNETGGPFRRPAPRVIENFTRILKNSGAAVTIRRERGSAAAAACGQLTFFSREKKVSKEKRGT